MLLNKLLRATETAQVGNRKDDTRAPPAGKIHFKDYMQSIEHTLFTSNSPLNGFSISMSSVRFAVFFLLILNDVVIPIVVNSRHWLDTTTNS